ncbi:hypothetical protein ACHAXA_002561 [Cyclostephanos tholiformis]|uniref:Serine aminopeptidase S33 domain-containing protein n=1 Tax=Cyclostephanos tholiformis TaxID=382380 RepID=A0ABD3R2L5_9STRA
MTTNNSTSTSPSHPTTTQAVALITLASALVISFALQRKSRKIDMSMPAKEGVWGVTESSTMPNLPPDFIVGSFVNSRSQSIFTINLPPREGKNSSSSSSSSSSFSSSSSPSTAKAMLVLVHGVGEHCCRPGYVSLFESLSDAGVDVYGLDHHGHGRSDGSPRGYAEKFDHYVDDVLEYVRLCRAKYVGDATTTATSTTTPPPLILMGQSMGGLVSVMAALRLGSDDVSGLVLTGPALGVDMNVVLRVQKLVSPAIDRLLPRAKIVDAVRPVDLSRNPNAVRSYVEDPLVLKGRLVARTAIGIDRAFDVVRNRRTELSCPMLILHGTADVVTSPGASLDFFRNVRSTNKRYLRLVDYKHEIFEDDPDVPFANIVAFVSSGGRAFADIDGGEVDGGEGVIDVGL